MKPSQKPDLQFKLVFLTPEVAKEFDARTVGSGANFREQSNPYRVRKLADDLLADRWEVNGETIKINKMDQVTDGLHRIRAIIMANKGAWVLMVFGVERDQARAVDTGWKRDFGQQLRADGVKRCKQVASATRHVLRRILEGTNFFSNAKTPSSAIELHDTLSKHMGIIDSCNYTSFALGKRIGWHSPISAFHYIASTANKEQADWYVGRIGSGVNLTDTDPAYHVRNILLGSRPPKKGEVKGQKVNGYKRGKLHIRDMMAYVIKGWNFTWDGKSVNSILWRPTGYNSESFPEIRGAEDFGKAKTVNRVFDNADSLDGVLSK